MILYAYLTFSAIVLALTRLSKKSHGWMNALAILHGLGCLCMSACLAIYCELPLYYMQDNFFIDALGVYEVAIAAVVFTLAGIYVGGHAESLIDAGFFERRNLNMYYLSFNILLTVTVLCFFSNNLALFWILTELTTFFSALLIAVINSKKNIDASLKYIFVTSTAMLFSFIGLIILFALTESVLGQGTLNWDALLKNARSFPLAPLTAGLAFVFIGFAAKSGIAPFHTTLPHAYSKAPSAVSAIMSAVMLNLGIYGILRIDAVVRQTDAAASYSALLTAFGLASLFVAAFSMLQQKNLKKLIAFSSTEHAGLMLLGIGVGTPLAVFWVLYHILAHSLSKALLFFSAGIIRRQYLSSKSENIKNLLGLQPAASMGLVLGALAITGIPPTMVFASKLFLLVQIGGASIALLSVAVPLIMIAGCSFALFLADVFSHGEKNDGNFRAFKTPARMKVPVVILAAAIFILGIFFPPALAAFLEKAVAGLGF